MTDQLPKLKPVFDNKDRAHDTLEILKGMYEEFFKDSVYGNGNPKFASAVGEVILDPAMYGTGYQMSVAFERAEPNPPANPLHRRANFGAGYSITIRTAINGDVRVITAAGREKNELKFSMNDSPADACALGIITNVAVNELLVRVLGPEIHDLAEAYKKGFNREGGPGLA